MGQMAAFFTIYVIQTTFLINMIRILDLGHFFVSFVIIRIYKFIKGVEFKDTFPFDLGYWLAFSSTIGMLSLIFSTAMPLLSLFAMIFFATRYFIEKYNILFVYRQDFDSKGNNLKAIVTYQIIGIIAYQLLNFAFLTSLGLPAFFQYFAWCFIAAQFFVICGILQLYKWRPFYLKKFVETSAEDEERKQSNLQIVFRKSI
jgi:hypothetical protein